ncbi:hypothetical protein [Nigerium massiliense]|nr:hypothetical protein [Nigerium massiliense]
MADVLDMQHNDQPDTPEEEKASNQSYLVCRNSNQSQAFCWRW